MEHATAGDGAGSVPSAPTRPRKKDAEHVWSVFRSLVRDWSAEGAPERALYYDPIVTQLKDHFAERLGTANAIKVLVPGAGLGRLGYDLRDCGFHVEASELSHQMCLCTAFLVHAVAEDQRHTVFPFVHHVINNRCREDQLRPVVVPEGAVACSPGPGARCRAGSDAGPARAAGPGPGVGPGPPDEPNTIAGDPGGGSGQGRGRPGQFTMKQGDFVKLYTAPEEQGQWHAVVTCFFLDTAHNVFEYVDTIRASLVPGGVWLNVGPLLWHFADSLTEQSIELPWADLREVITGAGFAIVAEDEVHGPYTANPRGLMYHAYTSISFRAIKTE